MVQVESVKASKPSAPAPSSTVSTFSEKVRTRRSTVPSPLLSSVTAETNIGLAPSSEVFTVNEASAFENASDTDPNCSTLSA